MHVYSDPASGRHVNRLAHVEAPQRFPRRRSPGSSSPSCELRPELILISAGYDAHAADSLGGMRLESASYGRFTAALGALAREVQAAPLVLLLEGGYDLRALTESVAATAKGVEEDSAPAWEYAEGVRPVEAVREVLSPFWESL